MQARRIALRLLACALMWTTLDTMGQKPDAAKAALLQRADAAFHAGFAAQQSGNLELARAKFTEVVRLEPQIPEAHEALGAVLLEMNNASEAIVELETAARLKPGESGNEANLALAYAAAGNAAKAIPHFVAALHAKGGAGSTEADVTLFDAYGRALAAVGRLDDAIAEFAAEEKIAGPSAETEDAIGTLYAQQRKWDEARKRFERALALDGSLTSVRFRLGVVLREQGDLAGSVGMLAAAAQASPENGSVLFEYAETLAAAGRDDDAAAEFAAALKATPELPGAALELAMEVGIENIAAELLRKRAWLVPALVEKGYAVLNGSAQPENASAIISFYKPGQDMAAIQKRLEEAKISVSLRAKRSGQHYIRLSPHYYNTDAELRRVMELL